MSVPSSTAWVDDSPVNPGWAAPTAVEAPDPQRPRVSGWVVVTAIVVAAVLSVVAVWGLGGFQRRQDLLIRTPPGAVINTGPYEFTFANATAQHVKDFGGETYWQVSVIGTGRTTGTMSITPNYADNGMFVSRDPKSPEVQVPTGQRFGDSRSFSDGAAFTPGLPAKRFQVDFKYGNGYQPSETIRFLVFQLEYRDNSLLADGDKSWSNALHAYQMYLPVTVLPAKES